MESIATEDKMEYKIKIADEHNIKTSDKSIINFNEHVKEDDFVMKVNHLDELIWWAPPTITGSKVVEADMRDDLKLTLAECAEYYSRYGEVESRGWVVQQWTQIWTNNLRYGTFCVIFLGIVVGLSSFTAFLLLKNRPELSYSTVILLLLMTIFGVASVTFVIASLLLLVAVLANNAGLMPYYLWLTITYWISQFALGILIPLVLIFEAEYPVSVGLAWSCIVVFLGLLARLMRKKCSSSLTRQLIRVRTEEHTESSLVVDGTTAVIGLALLEAVSQHQSTRDVVQYALRALKHHLVLKEGRLPKLSLALQPGHLLPPELRMKFQEEVELPDFCNLQGQPLLSVQLYCLVAVPPPQIVMFPRIFAASAAHTTNIKLRRSRIVLAHHSSPSTINQPQPPNTLSAFYAYAPLPPLRCLLSAASAPPASARHLRSASLRSVSLRSASLRSASLCSPASAPLSSISSAPLPRLYLTASCCSLHCLRSIRCLRSTPLPRCLRSDASARFSSPALSPLHPLPPLHSVASLLRSDASAPLFSAPPASLRQPPLRSAQRQLHSLPPLYFTASAVACIVSAPFVASVPLRCLPAYARSGPVVGLSSFTAFLLLKNRPELSYSTVILLLLMTIFGVASVTFVIASLLLLVAVLAAVLLATSPSTSLGMRRNVRVHVVVHVVLQQHGAAPSVRALTHLPTLGFMTRKCVRAMTHLPTMGFMTSTLRTRLKFKFFLAYLDASYHKVAGLGPWAHVGGEHDPSKHFSPGSHVPLKPPQSSPIVLAHTLQHLASEHHTYLQGSHTIILITGHPLSSATSHSRGLHTQPQTGTAPTATTKAMKLPAKRHTYLQGSHTIIPIPGHPLGSSASHSRGLHTQSQARTAPAAATRATIASHRMLLT
ncbi:hypothetical protein MSG28_008146 [Choristoneura fumiferana]|uniref:Uncharacterized protein n=1 Tax=Choristoneura fumiferana TaxID=7141 RepID=A0ACC0JA80_CHOFU|nr:hypothetical protein MSG28_008146 [Choristoneura fumiferana]